MNTINIEPRLNDCLVIATDVNGNPYTRHGEFIKWIERRNFPSAPWDEKIWGMVLMDDGTVEILPPKLIKF